jgi:hypothetical protein
MATERTMIHPSGYVIHFEVADETYMHPSGYVVNGDIEEAGGGFQAAWATRQQNGIIGSGVN